MVMRNLWEQVMHHMCADVVLDLIEDAIVPVQCGEPSTQVGPLLTPEQTAVQVYNHELSKQLPGN